MVTVVEYLHRFNYREIESRETPLLQLRLVYPSGSNNGIDFDVHLDSGCEGSLFNGYLLQVLGGTVMNNNKKRYGSTVGDGVDAYLHNVQLSLPSVMDEFHLEIGFTITEIKRNLLGRNFFDLAQIGFRERRREYYLTFTP